MRIVPLQNNKKSQGGNCNGTHLRRTFFFVHLTVSKPLFGLLRRLGVTRESKPDGYSCPIRGH